MRGHLAVFSVMCEVRGVMCDLCVLLCVYE